MDQHLKHMLITGATTGLTIETSDVQLDGVNLMRNQKGLVILNNKKPGNKTTKVDVKVTNSVFSDEVVIHEQGRGHRGIMVVNITNSTFNKQLTIKSMTQAVVNLDGNHFTYEQGTCFSTNLNSPGTSNLTMLVKNSNFGNCKHGIFVYISAYSNDQTSFIVYNCSFSKIQKTGFDVTGVSRQASPPVNVSVKLVNSKFFEAGTAVNLNVPNKKITCDMSLYNCTFASNTQAVSLKFVKQRSSRLSVMNSTFLNHSKSKVISVSTDLSYKGMIAILNNTFINNSVTTVIEHSGWMNTIRIQWNILNNPASIMELTTTTHRSDDNSVLNASHNWWGTPVKIQVLQRIHGFYLNPSRGIINFLPYLTDEKMASTESDAEPLQFAIRQAQICGTLIRNTTIPSGNYTVLCTIYIPEGLRLNIVAPSELKFHNHSGLAVIGKI